MASKPETVLKQIKELSNSNHSKSFLDFYNWLIEDEDSNVRNAINYIICSAGINPSYSSFCFKILK